MNQKQFFSVLFISFMCTLQAYDLTVVGVIKHADGLGRLPIGVIELLKDDLEINAICCHLVPTNVSEEVKAIALHPDKAPGSVSILFNPLWCATAPFYIEVPDSPIKIAYSMFESTCIPPEWTKILNENFDAVVVPDPFVVETYRNSGVIIPIFELPIGMFLDDFLNRPTRSRPSSRFVFGSTVTCDARKNYGLMIESFAEEFGNSNEVILKLNARYGTEQVYQEQIKSLGVSNIIFNTNILNQEQYLNFLDSFDCFINISKGEGFSVCPREALALGIPCILSRNSAQITICDTGLVREVDSSIKEPTNYGYVFGDQQIGELSNCAKEDVRAALRDVYENYKFFLEKARNGPEWVAKYSWNELKKKYLNLIKPKKILYGNRNIITDEYLMTNSKKLYYKYVGISKKME
jgi:glycosyltransferase involved in cell wall biosynthesis